MDYPQFRIKEIDSKSYLYLSKNEYNMLLIIEEEDLEKFIIVGDRVLVKPKNLSGKSKSGLYLPPSVQENEKLQSGYIVKVGPG